MDPVQRALWYVEGHLGEDVTLEQVAKVAGLSRHHLVRAFGWATGRSVMRYVRARRLSEAARRLADGAPDILPVALDAGYGSHEAFTRAFRDQFGVTPDEARKGAELPLVEPIKLSEPLLEALDPPRIITGPALQLAGVLERYTEENSAAIPNQWERFAPWFGHLPGQVAQVAYGVLVDDDSGYGYLTATEVAGFEGVPAELHRLRLPARRYAVWAWPGHVAEIRSVWRTIFTHSLPQTGLIAADASMFERYPESFRPSTGAGGFEIWIPLQG
jgi:AraC family transcriptional regulator